ncbi:aldose 1-epimerase [Prunus yedoensis var. nudiflora]|uniref:Aldose 1-epimerase n=1 Tax=Prunus yedoensis var. nudiflora TaxID=2094558 RepID=A0A314XVX3_PRUYE|nr:aldose 1-epimerase [Prunus yedoensis var. nudiflora]
MAKICVLLCFILLAASGFANVSGSETKGKKVGIYELKKGDLSVKFTNWGATIISLVFPDKNGKLADVVLGYDTIKEYTNDTSYIGAIVGRVANRIGGAQFTLNGTHYKLVANEGKNILHGGLIGFSDVVWKVQKYQNEGVAPHIVFTYHSADGEEGFPGDLLVTVSYTLLGDKQLSVKMKAKALNKPTPVNLAQHTYWNLGGHNCGDVLSQYIKIFASQITLVDSHLIPTGKFASVKGTPYDFLKPKAVGSRINKLASGYDINYVLDGGAGNKLKPAAVVYDKKSGRVLELSTNAPGLQFYTSNSLKDVKGKGGFVYEPHAALCLETQGFPDAVNHPNFPSTIVNPKKPYKHNMLFKFSTKAPYAS